MSEIVRGNQTTLGQRHVMYDLFNRLTTARKRVIAQRQLKMLNLLLEKDEMPYRIF
jgi:hypothetical protein